MGPMIRWLGGAVVSLVLVAAPAWAVLIIVNPTSDRAGIDLNGDGIFHSLSPETDLFLPVQLDASFESRAGLEFSLLGVPAGAILSSATLNLMVTLFSVPGGGGELHGYTGDGSVALADLVVNNQ